MSLVVDGTGGVPGSDVGAVVLNVTVTRPTTAGFVTVYPDGSARPVASNLNFSPGETVPNLVVAPVGSDGKVDFYNGRREPSSSSRIYRGTSPTGVLPRTDRSLR